MELNGLHSMIVEVLLGLIDFVEGEEGCGVVEGRGGRE